MAPRMQRCRRRSRHRARVQILPDQDRYGAGVMDFENRAFIQLVKRTREKFGIGLDAAHDMIFADEEMRRLVAWRIRFRTR